MAHAPFHDPEFDIDAFRSSCARWATRDAKTIIVEWQTGPGPTVVWFPAGNRELSQTWRVAVSASEYNEQYADYLEHRLMPRLAEVIRANGLTPKVMCVDQQPIQIMRMRRREIEHAQDMVGGHGH